MEKEKLQMKENNIVLKKIFYNLIIAIVVMAYFVILNFAYANVNTETITLGMKISTLVIMLVGIIFLEIAYKKDSETFALNGIEFLVLAAHSLSIKHVVQILNLDFQLYVLVSSYLFSIYYVLKTIIIYTNDKRKYLKGLSDIPDIVKDEEPIKKEATKKKEEKDNNKKVVEEKNIENKEKGPEKKTKRKKKVEDKEAKNEEKEEKPKTTKTTTKKTSTKKSTAKKGASTKTTTKKTTMKKSDTPKTTSKTTTKKTTTKKKETPKKETNETNKKEETISEETKPKRRGRPKKEVKEND